MDFFTLDAFVELLDDSPFMPLLKEDLINFLVICRALVIDPPPVFGEDSTSEEIKSIIRDVLSIYTSFDLKKMNEYMALELCVRAREICMASKMFYHSYHIYKESPPPSRLYYPRTSPHVFIHNLLEILEELGKDTSSSIRPYKPIILRVQQQIDFWNSHIIEISSDRPNPLKDIIDNIINMAYEVEYVVDSFLAGGFPSWHCLFMLIDILKEFEKIESEGKDDEDEDDNIESEKTRILDMLFAGDDQLNVISVIGESITSFVWELYNSPSVIDYFDAHAWYDCARYKGDISRLLDSLRSQVFEPSSNEDRSSYEDSELVVYTCLKERRFLVVIKNMYDLKLWLELQRCLPESHNGSRILITSGIPGLRFLAISKSTLHDKIWKMRMKSLFQNENCPPELSEIGIKIAKRCKLVSVPWVIALFSTTEKTRDQWEEIANTLGSRILGQTNSQYNRILDLTCMCLPDYLRSCLFYVIMGYHWHNVSISKLIQLWIAEGFIKYNAFQTFEDTAYDYFADLVARNLLIPHEEGSNGRVKTCSLDSFVYAFLRSKIVEDNFLRTINGYGDISSISTPIIYHDYRLRIESDRADFFQLKPSGPFVRSLFFFCSYTDFMWYENVAYDISFIFENFKFLRVLNFEGTNIGDSLLAVGVLVLLRYLAFRSSADNIPPCIANLQNLETFIFEREHIWSSKAVKVTDSIWNMTKLRHFHVADGASFDLEPHLLEKDSPILDNLQTFSTPYLAYGDNMEKIMRRLKIRKLKCVFVDSWDDDKNCNQFPVLDFLKELVSLKVFYKGKGKFPCKFNFPSNLKKISLLFFGMPWINIYKLTVLCNLEVLKLLNNAFKGKIWEMEDDLVFPKLKYLELENLDIMEWCASRDHFPNLDRLVLNKCKWLQRWSATSNHFPHLKSILLKNCDRLKKIPLDFAYINTINRIEVSSCPRSAARSATLIQEWHKERWGNDKPEIKVVLDNIPDHG